MFVVFNNVSSQVLKFRYEDSATKMRAALLGAAQCNKVKIDIILVGPCGGLL